MENQLPSSAHRRINLIASHFAATDDFSLPTLLPLSCSSAMKLGAPRGDSRMYFARQGSSSQAFFARQVSHDQQGTLPQPDVTVTNSPPPTGMSVTALNRLMYSRPATLERKYHPSAEEVQPFTQDCSLYAPDPPKFARPSSIVHEQDMGSHEQIGIGKPGGTKWSPAMDVVETEANYVLTVEIPGATVGEIRVEVNNEKLVVMGKRANPSWKVTSSSSASVPRYHTRTFARGSYQVDWPLPADANRDTVSAQFMNGVLLITIPKLQGSCA